MSNPTAVWQRITPAIATEMLAHAAPNRNVRASRVEQYARDMAAGKWQMNGEAIQFDHTGQLVNGQHRLRAIVEAAVPVDLLVVRGVNGQSGAVFDSGAGRTMSDVLSFGGVKNAATVAAGAANWWLYEHDGLAQNNMRPTRLDLTTVVETVPELVEAAHDVQSLGLAAVIRPGVATFVGAYLLRRGMATAWEDFRQAMAEGAGLPKGHPYLLLRNRFLKEQGKGGSSARNQAVALSIKAVNAVMTGRTIATLKWQPGMAFPKFAF